MFACVIIAMDYQPILFIRTVYASMFRVYVYLSVIRVIMFREFKFFSFVQIVAIALLQLLLLSLFFLMWNQNRIG